MRLDRRAQAPSRFSLSLFLVLPFLLLTSVTPPRAAALETSTLTAQGGSAPAALDAATSALLGRGVAALETGPQAGFVARGTATLLLPGTAGGPSGAITQSGAIEQSGAITITAWGGSHCRVEIDFGPTASSSGGQKYVAVLNGRTATASGPGWVGLPSPAGLAQGCGLLPQGLPLADLAAGTAAAGAVSDAATTASTPGVQLFRMAGARALRWSAAVELDPSSGLPTKLSYEDRKQAVEVTYSGYQTGSAGAYPAEIEETVGGVVRLKVELSSLEAHSGFSETDFPVPAPPEAAPKQGGVQ